MPRSGCSALHGVDPNLKKNKKTPDSAYVLKRGTNWNEMEPPGTSWDYLERAGTTWKKLGLPGTIWNKVEPPGTRWILQ